MGGRGNAGEETRKALWILSAFRIFPVGSEAPLLVKFVLQSSGAQTPDPGFSGAKVGPPR